MIELVLLVVLLVAVTIVAYLYVTTRFALLDCRQELEWANAAIASKDHEIDILRPHRIPLSLDTIEENTDKIDDRIDELNL